MAGAPNPRAGAVAAATVQQRTQAAAAEAHPQARAQARVAERARCKAIIDSNAAAGRRRLALQLALTTDLEPSAAHAILAAAAPETDPAADIAAAVTGLHRMATGERQLSPLALAMASAPTAPAPAAGSSEVQLAAQTVALFRQVRGLSE